MSKQIQKSLSLFLLAVVLATQVGLHLLHHHASQDNFSADTISSADNHQHCAVCGLDLFIAQELPSEFYFSITHIYEGVVETPATSASSFSIIFNSGRAPPVC